MYSADSFKKGRLEKPAPHYSCSNEAEHRIYRLRSRVTGRGFDGETSPQVQNEQLRGLEMTLARQEVPLSVDQGFALGPHADAINRLLKLFPDVFFKNGKLRSFRLGGEGRIYGDDGSEYDEKTQQVHIYNCIMTQPKDVFLRVVCHELGHSFFEPYLKACDLFGVLQNAHAVICKGEALFARITGHSSATSRSATNTRNAISMNSSPKCSCTTSSTAPSSR